MKRIILCWGLVLGMGWANSLAQQTQGASVQSAAGGAAQSGSSTLIATIGQPSPPGQASAGQLTLSSGFIFTLDVAGTNQPPSITHTTPSLQPSGQNILIIASVTDDRGIDKVELNYRRGGEVSFTTTRMTFTSGSNYQTNIPSGFVTSRGVEYFVVATDVDGAQTRKPDAPNSILSIQILVTSEVRRDAQGNPMAQPNGSAQTAYRLISVPLLLDNPSAAAVLEDDLGAYDNTKWRLFGLAAGPSQNLNNKEPYVEFPNAGANAFAPGTSLFLIVKDPGKIVTIGASRSIRTEVKFSIPLQPGHNFVATPFNFAVPVGKLSLKSGGSLNALKTYGGGSGFIPEQAALQPWEGYYFPNVNQAVDTLFVNANLSSSASNKTTAEGWRLQILASCAAARDDYNFAGVAPASVDEWDGNDLAEPPPIGEYVSLYFPHPEWQKALSRFSDDIRAAATSNQQWRFNLATNISNEIVTLRFEGLKEADPNLAVFLVDEEMNYKQNLRDNAVYQYQSREIERVKDFTLLVGKEDFVAAQTAGVQGVPEDFVLEQNFPNPFNSETLIRFGLPKTSVVTIKILDLNGREVTTILDKVELPAGRHQRLWNGRDDQGRLVTSGVYLYRLRAGDFTKMMKLTLMK